MRRSVVIGLLLVLAAAGLVIGGFAMLGRDGFLDGLAKISIGLGVVALLIGCIRLATAAASPDDT